MYIVLQIRLSGLLHSSDNCAFKVDDLAFFSEVIMFWVWRFYISDRTINGDFKL